MRYKAFLSYSHREDLRLAGSIHSALQRFSRRWYKPYAIRIFRDKTSLSANPALWPSIARALDDSEYFLLLASPAAKASPWVAREIEAFLASHSPDKILIALTRGVIAWDAAARDFDWTLTTALPECLAGRFRDEPLHVDLTWVAKGEQLSLRHAGFRSAILDIAAPLHGRPKDDLDSDDLRQHRRTLRLAWSAVTLLSVLSISLALAAFYATRQRNEATRQRNEANVQRRTAEEQRTAAEEQRGIAVKQRHIADLRRQEADAQRQRAEEERQTAISRQLAAQALSQLSSRLDLALLQGVQATLVRDTDEARSALLSSLFYSPHLRRFLWREPGTLRNAVFSADGRMLVALADDSGAIRLRTIDSSGRMRALRELTDMRDISSIAVTKDATRLVTAAARRVLVREARAGAPVASLPIPDTWGAPDVLAFSTDGTMLAGYKSDAGVMIWNLETRALQIPPLRPKRWETALAFSPDGSTLASGGHDGTIVLWDVRTGHAIGSPLQGHTRKIFSLTFSPDGRVLASGSEDRTVRLWDPASGRSLGAPLTGHEPWPLGHEKWGLSVAFSPDGALLASAGKDGNVILWDVAARQRFGPALKGHPTGVVSIAFSKDGTSLVSVGQDGTVLEWAIDSTTAAATALEGHGDGVLGLAFSPDGRTLAAASLDRTAMLWDVATRRLARPPWSGYEKAVIGIAFAPGRNSVLAATSEQLIERNLLTGRSHVRRWTVHPHAVSRIGFAPDERFIASSDGITLILSDTATGSSARLPIPSASPAHEITSLAFSPDSRMLASGGFDGTLALWDVQTRRLLRPALKAHREAVQALAFSPDGRMLASAGVGTADYDDNVRLWDATTGRQLLPTLGGHEGPVRALAFSSDGKMLAAGDLDRVVLWRIDRRQRIGQPLTGHQGPIVALAFSPDGEWLASGGYDDRVVLWDLRVDSWRRRACRIVNRSFDETEWKELIGDAAYQPACR
jgi:WD40 repeat protein